MNIRNQLAVLAMTCFSADLPDDGWTKLSLARDGGKGSTLLIRLALAAVLMVIGLFLQTGGALWYLLLIVSVLVAGYDYIAGAALSLMQGKPLTGAVIVTFCALLALIVGDPVDAAAFLILYRIVTLLIGYVTDRTLQTLQDAVGAEVRSSAVLPAPQWIRWIAPGGLILALVIFIVQFWVREASAAIAVRSALSVLIIANPCAMLVGAPLTWYCAANGAYANNVLFRSCRAMRRLTQVRAVVLDDSSATSDDLPKVASVKSEKLPAELLLKLAAHAESRSNSRTARAILAAYNGELDSKLIDRALDIPECGVEAYISNLRICVGTRELMILNGITIPDEDLTDDYVVYVSVKDNYAGKLLLKEVSNADAVPAMQDLRNQGVRSLTLFSGAQNDSVTQIARDLKAEQLYCKLSPEEKRRVLEELQSSMPADESLLYIERDSVSHPQHSAADVDACMIDENNGGQFDADMLILERDLQLIPDAIETSVWVSGLCRENLLISAAVKAILIALALLGKCTIWFAVVLDGAAALSTLLLSIRAFGFDQPHRRLRDLLPKNQ